jgi:hypothetical protein
MKNSKHKFFLGLAGVACIACCAIPIGALIWAGAGSAAIGSYFASGPLRDLLLCGVPLLVIIGSYFLYRKHQSSCCVDPKSNCSTNQCGVPSKE